MSRVRVLLAEDHAVVREGTRQILERDPDFVVVGEAADGAQAVSMAGELEPDVLLLDLSLPVLNGIEVTRRVRQLPRAPSVVLLSAYDDENYVVAALEAGALGYLVKTAHSADVLAAVRAVCRGELVLHPAVARAVLGPQRSDGPAHSLSDREMAVLRLTAAGMRNREIAESLALSTRTVEGHLTAIYNKLGVGSRTEAIVRAAREGWLPLGEGIEQ